MSRIALAFGCFFKLLFGGSLPKRAAAYLPKGEESEQLAAPVISVAPESQTAKTPSKEAKTGPKSASQTAREQHTEGSLALLALFQREGRLVDFLREDIDGYEDADIGAAVRDIHRGCRKVLQEHLSIEAVMPGEEDDTITVRPGFDPSEIRLLGEVAGDPPFQGVLRHHGWRVTKAQFPALTSGVDRKILAPAQVEVS